MTQEKNKITGETKKYYYDSENRMTKYEHLASDISPIDITATYKYDIFGRRIQKNVNGNVINFFWENDTMTYELDASYQPIRKYLVGTGIDSYEGHLEYSEITDWPHLFDADYNQPWYSYIKDQVGTVYKVYSHKTRSLAESRAFDSFGNLVNQTGTTRTPLGFQGKYYDSESGLNYFYHRYYNPAIGRFMTEDPIGILGGINYYKFVRNNPIDLLDPTGLDWTDGPREQYKKMYEDIDKLQIKLKRILRENRTDIIESHKYCPKWGECFQECFHTAVQGDVELSMIVVEWFYLKGAAWWFMHRRIWLKTASSMLVAGEMVLYGGAISHLGIASYCAAQCALNPKSF